MTTTTDDEYDSFSDNELTLSDCNGMTSRQRDHDEWVQENLDVLLELYDVMLRHGRAVFGDAFWQEGNWVDFANMCYDKTQPFNFPNQSQ